MTAAALRVAVVVPCYNAAPFIEEALDTVHAQTRQPDEILVVDDLSTDDSAAVVERYAATHPLLRLLRHERNCGSGPSRNTGAFASRSDVIAFLDADDRWEPDHLEEVVGLLERHPDAVLSTTHAQAFGARDHPFVHHVPLDRPDNVFWKAFEYWIVPQNAVAIRRWAFEEIGGYREEARRAEDYDLLVRLAHQWPMIGSPRRTVWWRRHAGQQSEQDALQMDALRRRRVEFANTVKATASKADLQRMHGIVLRLWWSHIEQLAARGDEAGVQAALREGPMLQGLVFRHALVVGVKQAIGALYLSPRRGAPLRTAYDMIVRVRRRMARGSGHPPARGPSAGTS